MSLKSENNNLNRSVALDFYRLTNIFPMHSTNRVEDRVFQKDAVFDLLGERVFDNPRLLDLLFIKFKVWYRLDKGEFINSLGGCLYYYNDEFDKAEGYFLKAVNLNPQNLDNWLHLAFSLYHQGDELHELAKKILFDFDGCTRFFRNRKVTIKELQLFLRRPAQKNQRNEKKK